MKIAHKISALALALGLATNALAASGPESVGDVTLFGNITSYAPSWIWSVYDYPGGNSINLNPEDATTADGKDTYKLNIEPYIAAEGSISALTNSEVGSANFGYTDSISLSSNGTDVNFTPSRAMTIPAFVTTESGIVEGIMTMSVLSGRAVAEAYYNSTATPSSQGGIFASGRNSGDADSYENGDSCFTPTPTGGVVGVFRGSPIEGASDYPLRYSSIGHSLANLMWNRVAELLMAGVNTPQGIPPGFDVNDSWTAGSGDQLGLCSIPTVSVARLDGMNSGSAVSATAANVFALKPTQLQVPAGASGIWNASLTVIAAQI